MVEVGSEKVKVSGVKDVLGTRNRGLFHFVLKKNKDEILPKVEQIDKEKKKTTSSDKIILGKEDFRKIIQLQFIHNGSMDINILCIAGLLCGASVWL
jgi:hypothetical protein